MHGVEMVYREGRRHVFLEQRYGCFWPFCLHSSISPDLRVRVAQDISAFFVFERERGRGRDGRTSPHISHTSHLCKCSQAILSCSTLTSTQMTNFLILGWVGICKVSSQSVILSLIFACYSGYKAAWIRDACAITPCKPTSLTIAPPPSGASIPF